MNHNKQGRSSRQRADVAQGVEFDIDRALAGDDNKENVQAPSNLKQNG